MKINSSDEEIIIYLNNHYIDKVNFLDVDSIEDYMNDLMENLKKNYDLKINGYYNIDVYRNDIYGIIISMKKEDIEYYEYFNDQVDMQITIHNNVEFLYKINDFFFIKNYLSNNDFSLYKYNNELYIKLNKKVDYINLGNILEYCTEICYDIDKIIKANNLLFCNK